MAWSQHSRTWYAKSSKRNLRRPDKFTPWASPVTIKTPGKPTRVEPALTREALRNVLSKAERTNT